MKVLLASPHRDILLCYSRILEQEGIQTDTAFDGAEVLRLLAAGPYSKVILDLDLPRVEAGNIIRLLHEENTPVLALHTGSGSALSDADEAARPDDILFYPFSPEEFLEKLSAEGSKKPSGSM